ncbi:hypothetical protein BDR04DRAFT_938176, partial [Suillus decipiens]
ELDQSIRRFERALDICPMDHPYHLAALSNLATAKFRRGNAEDLDGAIALQRKTLTSCPVRHSDRCISLNNLKILLSTRFHRRGHSDDLDQAIALQREVLALRPLCHTN